MSNQYRSLLWNVASAFTLLALLVYMILTSRYGHGGQFEGIILREWPPSANRNVSVYLNSQNFFTLSSNCADELSEVKVLIVVQSAPQALDRREAARNTWMTWLKDFPQVRH